MKIVLSWLHATGAMGPTMTPAVNSTTKSSLAFMFSSSLLVGKRPESQLFLCDLPKPRQPVRLDDEEEDDQAAEDHRLQLFLQRDRQEIGRASCRKECRSRWS